MRSAPPRLPASLALTALLWSGSSCGRTPAARPDGWVEPPPPGIDSRVARSPWRDLGPLEGVPPRRVPRWPTLTALGDDLVVSANVVFPDSGAHAADFEVVTRAGASLGRPAGPFLFGHARAAVHASTGTYHLVWAESPEAGTASGGWPQPYSALWHAAYADGRWSAAVRIMEGRDIGWHAHAAPLAVDRAGCVHVVVPVFGDARQGLYHARGACAPWSATRIATRATYGAVTVAEDDVLLVALTGRDTTSPSDRNVVQVLRSRGGDGWTRIARVQVGGYWDRPQQVWIAARERRVHLAWLQVLEPGGTVLDPAGRVRDRGGSVFVHVASGDAGTRWADTVMSAPIAGPVFGARFVVHRCGVIALFETTADGSAFHVHEVDLGRSDAPSRPVFPRAFMSFEPAPVARGDTLLLLAGVLEAGSDTSVAHLASRPACHDAVIH